ncbi:MAG: Zn-ribbon domain-containing OB-fold protein [Pigmentiphaga sp.]
MPTLIRPRQNDDVMLPTCRDCGMVQYPPRELCCRCLSDDLQSRPVQGRAMVLATTVLHRSDSAVFQDRLPLRIASVQLAEGPVALVFLESPEVAPGDFVELAMRAGERDKPVLYAYARSGREKSDDQT